MGPGGIARFPTLPEPNVSRFRLSPATVSLALLCAAPFSTPTRADAQERVTPVMRFDSAATRALRWRMVGPARGGRVTAVAGVAQQPHTFYMGATGGGVWRTDDAGITWRNVSDGFFETGSIGAIDVSDSNPDVIYVGTGSEAIRSNVSIGKGVYRSGDGGKTWAHVGLRDVGQIGAVVVHPGNPSIVYVAAVGNPFSPNPARGVYRTRDGGQSWTRVLFVSDSTGAADLELQPGNPDVVYATMWRAERKPWTIISGAREGGVYRSTDAGEHWTKLGGGLPNQLVGKADLAVSAAAPNRLYVLMEARPGGGLYRSDDGGEHFAAVDTTTRGLITRPFYYTNVDADPNDADVVYVGTEGFYRSTDGGRSWRTMRTPHGDNHDLWINPRDSRIMIQSNDGGANVSLDGGRSWSTQYNQPTAEIYQVALDDQVPYRLYGAQQDNTTLILPSLPLASSAPDDPMQQWRSGPGCETGPIIPHATNPDTVYGSCKGQYSRMSLRTGQERQYWVGAQSLYGMPGKDLIYRFQRVSPMEVSRHDPRVVYYGSQYVHRTRDEGVTWERISPDLTWNPTERQQRTSGEPITIDATGEEMYSTLYAIRESPLDAQVIWTGANDGPFHVTRNGGRSWHDVTPKGLAPGGRVQNIEPSPHRKGSAYYAVYRYLLGDFRPYIYRTEDYGRSWTLITKGIPSDWPVRVVREDPVRAGLLYAGTEFGAFISFDNGAEWRPLQLNLPRVPVTDLRVQAGGDLVISTQGRSFWILDDVSPLRQFHDTAGQPALRLLVPREAQRLRYATRFGGVESSRSDPSDPQYIPPGAVLNFVVGAGASTADSATIQIADAKGSVVRSLRVEARPGLNRAMWDFTYPGPRSAEPRGRDRGGPWAPPGRYTATVTLGTLTSAQPIVVTIDPRSARDGISGADLEQQTAFNLKVRDLVSSVNRLVAAVREERTRMTTARVAGDSLGRVIALEEQLVTPGVRYSQPGLQDQISYLYSMTLGADQKVGKETSDRYEVLRRELEARTREFRAATGRDPLAR